MIPKRTDARLTWQGADRLQFTFTAPGDLQTWDLSISDIARDSDGDGWTDYEEARLGLDPHNPDTDGDGIPDGRDPAPKYRAPAADASNERVAVLQKAFFAAFGLTHARYLLFVRSNSEHFQPWGYRGPILFDHDIPDPKKTFVAGASAGGGIYVDWTVTKISNTAAVVTVSDYEGPLAASGKEILLKKYGTEWFVIHCQMTWIS